MQAVAVRKKINRSLAEDAFARWRGPGGWKLFAREALRVNLDPEQEAILDSVQVNPRTSVVSGTARGKDFVAAVIALCFLYLTPKWDHAGRMIENTKVVMTAPTDRQIGNIMVPEITRIFQQAKHLPGRLVGHDIRFSDTKEWYLTGFAADPNKPEAWAGLHAVNILFIVTEASGVSEMTYTAIEGNLQGNSRMLLVFNFNTTVGYAAESQRSSRWKRFRLNSLNAPNVTEKRNVIPGQVDYEWIKDKVQIWCTPIAQSEYRIEHGDFMFEGQLFRPNDQFRIKVLALPPKVAEGVLVPPEWIDLAFERWKQMQSGNITTSMGFTGTPRMIAMRTKALRLGNDVAGMGRDSSSFCYRFGNYVDRFESMHAGGKAEHMQVAGILRNAIFTNKCHDVVIGQAFIDTIGEGAGVYSRCVELGNEKEHAFLKDRCHSVKFSEKAEWNELPLTDITQQYKFSNMRAYLYWAARDWLDPQNNTGAALPSDEDLKQDLTQTLWKFMSDGRIQIEPKEELKKRLKRSPDKGDSLANTFYPVPDVDPRPAKKQSAARFFPG